MTEDQSNHRFFMESAEKEYAETNARVDSIESKGKTILTVNSLLLTAGVFVVMRGDLPQEVPTALYVLLALLLLGLLAGSYWRLLQVIELREYTMAVQGDWLLENHKDESVESLHKALAKYYSDASRDNSVVVDSKATHLEKAIRLSKWGFAILLLNCSIVLVWPLIAGCREQPTTVFRLEMPPPTSLDSDAQEKPQERSSVDSAE